MKLIKLMDESKNEIISLLEKEKDDEEMPDGKKRTGEDKFKELMKQLNLLNKLEISKGQFRYQEGDVDQRDEKLKDIKLHDGFDTVTGYRGSKLSGGQKQRVAIARTVIREPKVLMLDEATSALDEDAQKKVQVALERASSGRTTIIIAHRMSTIERCDKIFVLEHGKKLEEGTFDGLKKKGG